MGVLTGAGARCARARPARWLSIALVAIVPALGAGQDAGPAAPGRQPYAFVRIGTIFPRSADLDLPGFDAGGALEVGAGLPLLPHVSVEASAGWLAFQLRQSGRVRISDDPSSPIEEFTLTKRLNALPLLASVRASTRLGPLEVHALGGAGAYVVSYRASRESSLSGPSSLSTRDTTFGLHAGAGVAWSPSDAVTLGVDARYVSAKASLRVEIAPTSSTTTTQVRDFPLQLDGVVVAATVSHRF